MKLDRHAKCVARSGLHGDQAVHPADLDRARISIARDHLDTRDGASLQERGDRGPVVWWPIAETHNHFALRACRYVADGDAAQSTRWTAKEPLEDFVEASDAAKS